MQNMFSVNDLKNDLYQIDGTASPRDSRHATANTWNEVYFTNDFHPQSNPMDTDICGTITVTS